MLFMEQNIFHELDLLDAKYHRTQIENPNHKDIFFIWLLLVFISVFSAYTILGLTTGSPTGLVTAGDDISFNGPIMLGSLLFVFINILIVGLVHIGISGRDH